MTLQEAEEIVKEIKLLGPVTEQYIFVTDEGITFTLLPSACAYGCYQLMDFLTLIPHHGYSALFHGIGIPHHVRIPRMGKNFLWEQERYVYELEMKDAMRKALSQLGRAGGGYLPRIGEYVDGHYKSAIGLDMAPYPEDFALSWKPMVSWEEFGAKDVDQPELHKIKDEFCELLKKFIAAVERRENPFQR